MFPVKDHKALLDDEVTAVIREAAIKIAERFAIEMEAIRTYKSQMSYLCDAPQLAAGKLH